MVAQTVTIRTCDAPDLEHFERVGNARHAQYCREQFARGEEALTILVAAVDDGLPVGKLHLDFEERADRREAVLLAAGVAPELQSRGIGTQLMARAEQLALDRGCQAIVLGVEDYNPRARALYERLGYVAFEATDFVYEGAPVPNPGVWMRKELGALSDTRSVPKLLDWARRLQAIAQTGVAYGEPDVYDRERYEQVRQIAAEMFAADGDAASVEAILALETGHATPKLDVRGIVFRGDAILLVREEDAWSLPGGWVDVGESPSEAVEREVLEESGYRTRAAKLLALLDRERHDYEPHAWHIWKAIFLCELAAGEQGELSSETDRAAFFARNALPEPLRSGDATRAMIERAFEHLEHPEWPTQFD